MTDIVATLTAATPLVTAIGVLITVLLQFWNTVKSNERALVISDLEKNTNSMKDALVRITGESEHAKGIMQGRTEATAGIALAGVLEAVKPDPDPKQKP